MPTLKSLQNAFNLVFNNTIRRAQMVIYDKTQYFTCSVYRCNDSIVRIEIKTLTKENEKNGKTRKKN